MSCGGRGVESGKKSRAAHIPTACVSEETEARLISGVPFCRYLARTLGCRHAPLGRSISDQEHDALKVIGMTPRADPVGVELAFADQARIILDIEVERKWDRDYRNAAHGLSH